MPQAKIHVMQHTGTGLWAAVSDDMPGFVVHAHSEDELYGKLESAFFHFMDAIGQPVRNVQVEQDSPEGFWPPSFIAKGELDKAA